MKTQSISQTTHRKYDAAKVHIINVLKFKHTNYSPKANKKSFCEIFIGPDKNLYYLLKYTNGSSIKGIRLIPQELADMPGSTWNGRSFLDYKFYMSDRDFTKILK